MYIYDFARGSELECEQEEERERETELGGQKANKTGVGD